MASSLSNLVYNLSEGIFRIKCKLKHDDVELNINIATVSLNAKILKMIQCNTNVYVVTKTINTDLMKGQKNYF